MLRTSPHHVYLVALLALGLLMLRATTDLSAADHTHHRQLGPHVHGVAQMNLVVEGEKVFIELESPAMNAVGFEHQPSTSAQRIAVRESAEKLEDGGSLFAFSENAGCTLVSATIDSALLEHGEEEQAQGDSHEEHHDEETPEGKHQHQAEAESHGTEKHSEFEVSYQFTCASPKKLRALEVNIFEVFPGFEQIDAQILTTSGQSGAKISARNNRVDL